MEKSKTKESKSIGQSLVLKKMYFTLMIVSFTSFRETVGYLSDNEAFDRNLEQLKVRICVCTQTFVCVFVC